MSNATGRSVLGQPNIDKRRSAFEATKFSTSTDKADDDLESEFMNRFRLFSRFAYVGIFYVYSFLEINILKMIAVSYMFTVFKNNVF